MVKKILLTEEVEEALKFLYNAAMDFVGFPSVQPYIQKIVLNMVEEPDPQEKKKDG